MVKKNTLMIIVLVVLFLAGCANTAPLAQTPTTSSVGSFPQPGCQVLYSTKVLGTLETPGYASYRWYLLGGRCGGQTFVWGEIHPNNKLPTLSVNACVVSGKQAFECGEESPLMCGDGTGEILCMDTPLLAAQPEQRFWMIIQFRNGEADIIKQVTTWPAVVIPRS